MRVPSTRGYTWIQVNPMTRERDCPPAKTTRVQVETKVANRICKHEPGKMVTILKVKSPSERDHLHLLTLALSFHQAFTKFLPIHRWRLILAALRERLAALAQSHSRPWSGCVIALFRPPVETRI